MPKVDFALEYLIRDYLIQNYVNFTYFPSSLFNYARWERSGILIIVVDHIRHRHFPPFLVEFPTYKPYAPHVQCFYFSCPRNKLFPEDPKLFDQLDAFITKGD